MAVSEYALVAAQGAEMARRDRDEATLQYRRACHQAAKTTDSYDVIRLRVRDQLRTKLTEGGAKGMAVKVATIALWLRAGNSWPEQWGVTKAYDAARGGAPAAGQVTCPNCSHSFVPTKAGR